MHVECLQILDAIARCQEAYNVPFRNYLDDAYVASSHLYIRAGIAFDNAAFETATRQYELAQSMKNELIGRPDTIANTGGA